MGFGVFGSRRIRAKSNNRVLIRHRSRSKGKGFRRAADRQFLHHRFASLRRLDCDDGCGRQALKGLPTKSDEAAYLVVFLLNHLHIERGLHRSANNGKDHAAEECKDGHGDHQLEQREASAGDRFWSATQSRVI